MIFGIILVLLHLCCINTSGIRFFLDYTLIPSDTNQFSSSIQNIIEFTSYYTKQFVQVKTPNTNPIVISSCAGNNFASVYFKITNQKFTKSNTDFIVFVTIKNTQTTTLASSVLCETGLQGRPTAGLITFSVPLLLQISDTPNFNGFDFQRLVEITLREFIHLLAMNSNLIGRFTPTTTLKTAVFYPQIDVLPQLDTTRALEEAVKHFNCDTLTGIPLIANGQSYNLFPYFLFDDILSDYVGTEQVQRKLSRITLAILEDSGWYTVDYSFAQQSDWGQQKGCDFVKLACNQTTIPDEFCSSKTDNNHCTLQQDSYGTCKTVSSDKTCQILIPFNTANGMMTCSDNSVNIPWASTTKEVFSATSGCFQSTLYKQSGDLGQRCYQYTCENAAIKVKVSNTIITCEGGEIGKITKVEGSLTCPSKIQIQQSCRLSNIRSVSQYCSQQGRLTDIGCFCAAGKGGDQCQTDITCDSKCSKCQTVSALSCTVCITGYTLQDPINEGIGWCQLSTLNTCPTDCTKCQDNESSKCIICQSGKQLAEINQTKIGHCIEPISNCQRIEYNNDTASKCVECFTGYLLFQDKCVIKIKNCDIQSNNICEQCSLAYHQIQDQSSCIQDIVNCVTYSDDKLSCKTCADKYQAYTGACYLIISNCITQSKQNCTTCQTGYHSWNLQTVCNQDILFCSQYLIISDNLNANACKTCQTGYEVLTDICALSIANCKTLTSNSTSVVSQCQVCSTSFHLSGGKNSCPPDIEHCKVYALPENSICQVCDDKYELVKSGKCMSVIPNCKERLYHDEKQCLECVNGAYSLTQNNLSCTQPITNCFLANLDSSQKIICQTCEQGYHISTNNTLCFLDIPNCDTFTDQNCSVCNATALLSSGYCYVKIDGCSLQQNDSCQKCVNAKFLSLNKCLDPSVIIENCQVYESLTNCQTCEEKFSYEASSKICYKQLNNCQNNRYNSATKQTECDKCNDGYLISADNLICIKNIQNCVELSKDKQSCLHCEKTYVLDSQQNLCQPPILNCDIRSTQSPFPCLQCKSGFQMRDNGLSCYNCPIQNCQTCTSQQIIGVICNKCLDNYQTSPDRKQCNTYCSINYTELQNCLVCPYSQEIGAFSCTICTDGYYIFDGKCVPCSNQYSNSMKCTLNAVIECQVGYYLNTQKNYCYSCNNQKFGACGVCKSTGCAQCLDSYISGINNACVSCDNNCSECFLDTANDGQQNCLACKEGFFYQRVNPPDVLIPCTLCNQKFPNCKSCSINECLQCDIGYFISGGQCLKCDASCQSCQGVNKSDCTSCIESQLLQNNKCSKDDGGFQLTDKTLSSQALAYTIIQVNKMISSIGFNYYAKLDKNNNYFCQSDSECNMNGICLISMCKCINGVVGTYCQQSKTTDKQMLVLQDQITSYLINQPKPTTFEDLSNRIRIMATLSDTSAIVQESNAEKQLLLLGQFIDQLQQITLTTAQIQEQQIILLNCISAFGRGFQKQNLAQSGQLKPLDSLLDQTLDLSSQNQLKLPIIRVWQQIFNLKDPLQEQTFTSTYQPSTRILQANNLHICDNEKRITSPTLVLSTEAMNILRQAQVSASEPLQVRVLHLYYDPHVEGESQTIDSVVMRVQFFVNNTEIPLILIQPNLVLVPKLDQSFSGTDSNMSCLTWNQNKQVWSPQFMDNTLTVNCRFYVACYTSNFGDLAVQQVIYKAPIQSRNIADLLPTTFDMSDIPSNSGFWISLAWFLLFYVLWLVLWCQNKRAKSIKKYRDNKKKEATKESLRKSPLPSPRVNTLNTEHNAGFHIPIEQNQNLDSMPLSSRGLVPGQPIRKPIKKLENMWLVYPLYAISQESCSLTIKMQQVTLLILQLQIFTTSTAGFISIEPFSFSMLTVYYIVPVVISWFSNYLFGSIAVCLRKEKEDVNCFYWIIYLLIHVSLWILTVWCMFGLDTRFDIYLLVGVAIEFLLDLVLCDLFMAYLYQSLFEDTKKPVSGIFRLIRYRGYFIPDKK